MEKQSIVNNILLINKPPGPTSHDIVARIRKMTKEKRVGHAGTLDPFAEGLLIILVGREMTKRQNEFLSMNKTYEAVLHLGATSSTDDITGEIKKQSSLVPSEQSILTAIETFIGTFDQIPPPYSAKKIRGVPAYKLMRKGIVPKLQSKNITVYETKILAYEYPLLTIHCTVSSGTYIRALARDIGAHLGVGAYLTKLKRTSIGPYSLEDAASLPQ